MGIPYRPSPRSVAGSAAAYVRLIFLKDNREVLGGLLVVDNRGQPLEFVHASLSAPAGFLWPEATVRNISASEICHALFEACTRVPDILLCEPDLGDMSFCREELAPSIPFAMARPSASAEPAELIWINERPSHQMKAHHLAEELVNRGFLTEPFERIQRGLEELYPDAGWPDSTVRLADS